MTTPLIAPDQIPAVALDFMNEDHAEAVALVNELSEALGHKPAEKIDELLAELFQHNSEHFAREEQHMQEYGFPPYPVHKGEHDRVLAELSAVISYWQSDRDEAALQNYLQNTFVDWFENHLQCMDRVTAMFVASQMA